MNDDKAMLEFIRNALATKVTANWSDLITKIALRAVKTVILEEKGGKKEIDIKRYAKVEKVFLKTMIKCCLNDPSIKILVDSLLYFAESLKFD